VKGKDSKVMAVKMKLFIWKTLFLEVYAFKVFLHPKLYLVLLCFF